jgi:hypothetical protein
MLLTEISDEETEILETIGTAGPTEGQVMVLDVKKHEHV